MNIIPKHPIMDPVILKESCRYASEKFCSPPVTSIKSEKLTTAIEIARIANSKVPNVIYVVIVFIII
jgi:hypothetical protein